MRSTCLILSRKGRVLLRMTPTLTRPKIFKHLDFTLFDRHRRTKFQPALCPFSPATAPPPHIRFPLRPSLTTANLIPTSTQLQYHGAIAQYKRSTVTIANQHSTLSNTSARSTNLNLNFIHLPQPTPAKYQHVHPHHHPKSTMPLPRPNVHNPPAFTLNPPPQSHIMPLHLLPPRHWRPAIM